VREAAEQTQEQVKKPVSIKFSRRNEIFISFFFLTLTLSLRERGRLGAVFPLPEGEGRGEGGRTFTYVVRLITKFISFISKVLTRTQKHNFHYL
jgi:hypothetical protein